MPKPKNAPKPAGKISNPGRRSACTQLNELPNSPTALNSLKLSSSGQHSITPLEIHPLALAWPETAGEPQEALTENIKEHGLLMPAVTLDNKILDGRRRQVGCLKAGVELRTMPLPEGIDPVEYVIAVNGHRRHMSPSQFATTAANLMPRFEAQAAERKRLLSGTRRNADGSKPHVPEIVPGPDQCGEARELAAQAIGANPRYVSDAVRLKRDAPELFKEVHAGRILIPAAMRQLRKKAEAQKTKKNGDSCGHEGVTAKQQGAAEGRKDLAPDQDIAAFAARCDTFISAEFGDCSPESLQSRFNLFVQLYGMHVFPADAGSPQLLARRKSNEAALLAQLAEILERRPKPHDRDKVPR
jgi:hypothetical protein